MHEVWAGCQSLWAQVHYKSSPDETLLRASYRYKNKTLDLSRTVMLSGLLPGAKLELVAASRSPSVVSVALQLPQAEPDGTARLTDKFPSTTTLWLILRKFESSVGSGRNFTGRSAPLKEAQKNGSGRLFFETPVVTAMNRDLASFTDLQKTLAQLGVNSGSILLRLNFRKTDRPLEEAMIEIDQYFKEMMEQGEPQAQISGAMDDKPAEASMISLTEASAPPESQLNSAASGSDQRHVDNTGLGETETSSDIPKTSERPVETVTGPSHRPISIFAPPSSSMPKAALQKENDNDFEPTLDHVKSHQRYLQANSQNKTLKSDAQLAAEADAKAQKTAQIKEVEIKLRFPDQSQVSATFTNLDTARTLYDHTRELMQNANEPISLTFPVARGRQAVPIDSEVKLITGLGLVGRVLVEVAWGAAASIEARQGPILKDEYRAKAQEIPVKLIEGVEVEQNSEPVNVEGKGKAREGKKSGMPKWFQGIGKK